MFSGYCSFIANVLVSAFDFNFLLYPLVVYTAQFKCMENINMLFEIDSS